MRVNSNSMQATKFVYFPSFDLALLTLRNYNCNLASAIHLSAMKRDAQDAVYGRNGYDYGVYRLRVEFQRGRGAGGVGGGSRGRPGPAARRSDFRVIVAGLPSSGSWQDLKDHMREAGDVCYADVLGEGAGVVEFFRKEDMDYAIRKLDDTKFRSHEGLQFVVKAKVDVI
ncbi:hypothetical protein scyTo_0021988, partial [Scyliorhinus torazame]|nr:hypothetical protein [Scyliorhinus torazame]